VVEKVTIVITLDGIVITRPFMENKGMVNWRRLKDKIIEGKKSEPELLLQHYTTSTKLYLATKVLNDLLDFTFLFSFSEYRYSRNRVYAVYTT